MAKLVSLVPFKVGYLKKENKEETITEAKLTAKQMRSDLSNYINKNADKIAEEFIPKGTRYLVKKNFDGISFVMENSDTSKNSKQKELDYVSYIRIDIDLAQSSGILQNNKYFDKATISEGIDNWDMGKLDESLEDMDVSLPSKLEMFLDRTAKIVKNYNLSRAKEQLVIAKLVDALNMNPSELSSAVQKLKKYKIVKR